MIETPLGPTSHYFYSMRLKLHYVDWDYHIIAPDLRGHGDSQWAIGAGYSMVDYTLDVAQLLDALKHFPITIIGHSLGGSIALQYTGTYPGRVKQVVAIEGLGPPPQMIREDKPAQERMHEWIGEMQTLSRRHPRRYETLDDATARMRDANPNLSAEQAR